MAIRRGRAVRPIRRGDQDGGARGRARRELITGGVDSRLWLSVLVLVGILVGSLAISAWSAGKQRMWSVSRLHPELAI